MMTRRKIWDAIRAVVLLALGLAVFYGLFCLFLVAVRDGVVREGRYEAEAEISGGASEADAADMGSDAYEIYREGDGPAPAWYDPDEPMAAEWTDDEDYLLDVPLDADLQAYIYGLCEDAGLPYTLVIAVIEAESSYRADVISVTHDFGLMQINVMCHEWLRGELGVWDFLDPYDNVRAGIYILAGHYARCGYESGALVAYNMGRYGAERLFAQGRYTSDYSDRVLGIRDRLEREGA